MKRLLSLSLSILLFGLFLNPVLVSAACVDNDGDRYYACDQPDETPSSPFAKGTEEAVCDMPLIARGLGMDDEVENIIAPEVESVPGNQVNPGAIEAPNSNIDYNCDGEISGYIDRNVDTDLMGMVENVITLIGQIAVFISVGALVYGGIMFATASGEESKIQKAKKTIIGAVIGLIIGLVAWNIVGFVTDTFGG